MRIINARMSYTAKEKYLKENAKYLRRYLKMLRKGKERQALAPPIAVAE